MRLLDRFFHRAGYWEGMASGAAVLTTSYGSPNQESILPNLARFARDSYTGNTVVFAAILARLLLFSEVRFVYRSESDGSLTNLPPRASILENPWPNGTTGELAARLIQDADLAGNAYIVRGADQLIRLRPDQVTIVSEEVMDGATGNPYRRVIGYIHDPTSTPNGPPGVGTDARHYTVDEVMHWSPIPDPDAEFRGLSWLTPILREIMADNAMTDYKQRYLANAASPNLLIKYKQKLLPETIDSLRERMQARYGGADNAFKTLILDQGADTTVIGNSFEQMQFATVQSAGEARILAASGVPPIVCGVQAGLDASTYCMPWDEPVWTPQGPRPIGTIQPGDMVWSHVDGGLSPRRVTWQSQTGLKTVYRIQTKNRVLHATGNHPVLVRRSGSMGGGDNDFRRVGVEWRRVDELKVGDRVVQAQCLPDLGGDTLPTGARATPELLQWLGAYIGDGCGVTANRGRIAIAMPPTDRAREHYLKLTRTLFEPTTIEEGERFFGFHSVLVRRMLRTLGVSGTAKTKRVPQWVYGLTRELRLAFLAGLVDTDGSIDKRGTLKIQLANHNLVEDVKMLLVGCGIQTSNLYHAIYDPSVLPNPGIQESYEAWAVVASSADEVADIPFVDWLYRERVEENTGRRRRGGLDAWKTGLDRCLGFYTIRSIEPEGVQPVYDIEVENGHSFIAAGIVVHNSNYAQAMRKFADYMRPTWRSCCASLAKLVPVPAGTRLWYDTRDIAALRQGEKEAADTALVQAQAIGELVRFGYDPMSAVAAVQTGDLGQLKHEGIPIMINADVPLAKPPPITLAGPGAPAPTEVPVVTSPTKAKAEAATVAATNGSTNGK